MRLLDTEKRFEYADKSKKKKKHRNAKTINKRNFYLHNRRDIQINNKEYHRMNFKSIQKYVNILNILNIRETATQVMHKITELFFFFFVENISFAILF